MCLKHMTWKGGRRLRGSFLALILIFSVSAGFVATHGARGAAGKEACASLAADDFSTIQDAPSHVITRYMAFPIETGHG